MRHAAEIADFVTAIKVCLPFQPNQDQQAAIEQIARFVLQTESRSVFVLKGYAGTGKTNLMSAVTQALPSIRRRSVLLAPTGRAAKVLSLYARKPAQTIHKKIFRKQQNEDGTAFFSLAENLHKNTLFIVDESSMISADTGESLFTSLLESLFEYVYSGENCKLILIGDTAQLPPVGTLESPALNISYLQAAFHLNIHTIELKEVARQRLESGILHNATKLRSELDLQGRFPHLECSADVVNLTGDELEDCIQYSISKYGEENVIIITRSNKRANLFNQSFRNRIKLYEEDLCVGDRIMVVKNNYFWLPENNGEAGFIANGDMAEITRIAKRQDLYGFHFCDCQLRFIDYPNLPEQEVKMMTDTLHSDHPTLAAPEQKQLYESILADVADEPSRHRRSAYLRESPFYNALQVKFSYAITCHKSQGGQWPVVFIDQGFLKEENVDESFMRWLYTAITRATEQVYLVNFHPDFFV
jgi:exodeoxyribonuclease-5